MIFPYEIVPARTRTVARLIQPAAMAERFPGCLAYLEARRAELDRRHVAGGAVAERQFYQSAAHKVLLNLTIRKLSFRRCR